MVAFQSHLHKAKVIPANNFRLGEFNGFLKTYRLSIFPSEEVNISIFGLIMQIFAFCIMLLSTNLFPFHVMFINTSNVQLPSV